MNWQKLREKYFKECVYTGKIGTHGQNYECTIILAPHDLFEWFKREVNECKLVDTEWIPFQCCPVCNGVGRTIADGMTSNAFQTCTVCNGNKVIPMSRI